MARVAGATVVLLAPVSLAQHSISVWETSQASTNRLTPVAPLQFTGGPAPTPSPNATVVTVNASATYQTIVGFGGAITEAAVYVFNELDAAGQAQVLQDLYGENANGTSLHYSMGRLTIGSCDFALGYYSYNDKANDTSMSNFTVAHDQAQIIPFLLRAQSTAAGRNTSMKWLSTPWSPPAWMKTNGLMSCFPLGPLDCALIPEFQPAYALYFSRYLSAYAAAGVRIWAVTPQNEPQPQTGTLTYEGMWFPFTAELEFVAQYLGPQLRADHPDVLIFIFDHNQADAALYATPILADPVASQYVAGTAFHWYSGPDWSALDALSADFPDKLLLASESTVALEPAVDGYKTPTWANGEYYGTFILNDLLHNAVGFIDWNILLDQNGAPDHGDPTGERCEGIIRCGSDAMLIADVSVSPPVVYKQTFYFYMGHVSRFVPPGSVRTGSAAVGAGADSGSVTAVAFARPATGDNVVVVMNKGDTPVPFVLLDARFGAANTTLPPHSIQTWVY